MNIPDVLQECVNDLLSKAVETSMQSGVAQLSVDDVLNEVGGIYTEKRIRECLHNTVKDRANCQQDGDVVTIRSALGRGK